MLLDSEDVRPMYIVIIFRGGPVSAGCHLLPKVGDRAWVSEARVSQTH